MLYIKTTKAWESLAHPAHLGRLAHTVVLLANGKRTVSELNLLTGTKVNGVVIALHEAGYLETQTFADPPTEETEWH